MDELLTYVIANGVRRAKAALLCGKETIDAQIDGSGIVFAVPLKSLRSPKENIDTWGVRGLSWDRLLRATQNNVPLPPIEITYTGFGIPLADVTVGADGENWDDFKQTYGK